MTLTSVTANEFPVPTVNWKRPALSAATVLLLTFGVFGGWAMTARLDSAATANGHVAVEGDRKVVQNLEGGIVKQILVTEDQHVQEGDILFRIDPTQAQAGADMIGNQLQAALAQEARYVADLAGQSIIAYPDSVPASLRADQDQQLADALAARKGDHQVYAAQITQLTTQIAGFATQKAATQAQLDSLTEQQTKLKSLFDQQLIPATQIYDVERNITDQTAKLAAFDSEVTRINGVIAETQAKDAQIDRSAREDASTHLVAVRSTISDLKQKSLVSADVLDRSAVRAPKAGKIVNLAVHTPGQVVRPGDTLLEIVPDDGNLIVTARLSPLDVTHVHPGLEAEIRLPSFKQRTTPLALGKVISVSADAVTDEASKQSYYELNVSMDTKDFPEQMRQQLVAGMPAEVIVETGERTVMDYLIQPMADAMRIGMREQ